MSNTIGSVLADLALVNAASPDPVDVGGELTYKLTVTNHGLLAVAGVVVADACRRPEFRCCQPRPVKGVAPGP